MYHMVDQCFFLSDIPTKHECNLSWKTKRKCFFYITLVDDALKTSHSGGRLKKKIMLMALLKFLVLIEITIIELYQNGKAAFCAIIDNIYNRKDNDRCCCIKKSRSYLYIMIFDALLQLHLCDQWWYLAIKPLPLSSL